MSVVRTYHINTSNTHERQDHDQVAKCGAKMVKNEVDNRELNMNSTKQPTSWQ